MHGTVCNYTLNYAHLNGTYQGWGVIATMYGLVYQPPWTFRPSCYPRMLPIDTCLVSKKFYKSPLTNYDFGGAIGALLLKLQNFKKVKLIFGHPVCCYNWPRHLLQLTRTYGTIVTSGHSISNNYCYKTWYLTNSKPCGTYNRQMTLSK